MAFHHQHHHHQIHQTAATSCCCSCCQPPPCHHYTPPPAQPSLGTDPVAVAAIVYQLLQPQNQTSLNPYDFYCQTFKPTNISRKQRHPCRETDQFQHSQSGFFSLLQRVDALEAALHRVSCSSSSSFSLRDAAARTIQTHFRAYLVRRSRALRQLKELASIKSAVVSLKSSFSRRGFVDFDSLSSRAMELLLHLDSIQGDDQMVRDSKRSITKEIDQFLDLLDGICVKRHQVVTKAKRNMRLVRNDDRTAHDEHDREFSDRGVGSKCRNLSNEEKKLLENLKFRAERIGRLSREFEDDEEDAEMEGYKHVVDEVGNYIAGNSGSHRMENGGSAKKHVLHPSGKKHVSFLEDGNVVRVYDIDENTSQDDNEFEGSAKVVHDEDEA